MKKFFQEIKADLQFKTAGPGQKLSESPREKAPKEKPKADPAKSRQGPTNEAQMAAAAALARLEQKPKPRPPSSQDAIRSQVKKELMAEAAASDKGTSQEERKVKELMGVVIFVRAAAMEVQYCTPHKAYNSHKLLHLSSSLEKSSVSVLLQNKDSLSTVVEDSSMLSVPGVYFTCPLTGVTVRKDQKEAHIRKAIFEYASKDPVAASIMEIHTFNRDREKVKLGVETIAKYLDNIHLHPEEEKYRKIKLQNKVFQEKIRPLEGAHSFFQAVGFEKLTLSIPGQEETTEDFYVLKEAALEKVEDLKEHKEKLLSGEPVRCQLDRQLHIFQPSPQASHFELPADFFNLTAEELKREQRLRSESVEKASMLRTKAMREKEEQRELRKYNYTLLRVRFPDGYILQGTFYAREPISALYTFVRETLQNDWLPFELLAPGGHKLTDESGALNECGLVPSALLTFAWDADVMADIKASGGEHMGSVLKPDLLLAVQILS